jgi:hypothetical protein
MTAERRAGARFARPVATVSLLDPAIPARHGLEQPRAHR